jgi:integrase
VVPEEARSRRQADPVEAPRPGQALAGQVRGRSRGTPDQVLRAEGRRRERDFDARTGAAEETKVDHSERLSTFREYGDRWRLSREIGWALETRKRVESNLRCHLYPVFGNRPIKSITLTGVLEWLTGRLADNTPKSSLKLYFELLDAVMAAAVTDKVIPENPCDGVKLAQVLRGLSRAPKWVPTPEQVNALMAVVPHRYLAAIWLGAGAGLRLGEALGMESGDRCTDYAAEELNVVQQLRYSPRGHGGFYLCEPKAGSSGTVHLDPAVAQVLAEHVRQFPPKAVELSTSRRASRSSDRFRCCSPRRTATRSTTRPGRANGWAGGTRLAGRPSTGHSTRCGTSSPPR